MNRPAPDTFRFLLLAAMTAAAVVLVAATPLRHYLDRERIQEFSRGLGWYGVAVLLFLSAVTPLLMVPRMPLAMAAGFLYGTLWGAVLANVGGALGAVGGFLFARHMGRAFVLRRLGPRRAAVERLTERYGPALLMAVRATPVSSFAVTNYLAAVSPMRLGPYAAASFVGMIPSSVLFAFMGKMLKQPAPGLVWLVGGVFAAFAVLTVVAGRYVRRRLAVPPGPSPVRSSPGAAPPPAAPPPT
jgi:uncharacterized membrane protein YdjX (TVP38/TMEM64 family)